MTQNVSSGLSDDFAAARHRWCHLSSAEQLICCSALPSPVAFALFLLLVFRKPLRAIETELAFFASAQRVLLTLDALELASFAVALLNVRIFRLAFGRAIVLYLSFTTGFACQLASKLYLLGLTALRIYAIRRPLGFAEFHKRRCLTKLWLVAAVSAVTVQLAFYHLGWGGRLTTEWKPQSDLRQPYAIRTVGWIMILQASVDCALAPAALILVFAMRQQRRRFRRGSQRQLSRSEDATADAENRSDSSINLAIVAETLAGLLVTMVVVANAASVVLSGGRWRRRLRPWIYALGVQVVAGQKLACVLVPVVTCRRLREEIFTSLIISSSVWIQRMRPMLRLTVIFVAHHFAAIFFAGLLRLILPHC